MSKIRIASVAYLNAHPLTRHIDRERFDFVEDHPSVVARWLAEGEVDVALCPVAAVLTDGEFKVVPGVCIGALGDVTSVFLTGETPLEQWTEVVLDGVSRSSVVLARLLLDGPLKERCRDDLRITSGAPGDGLRRVGGTVGALIIGDAAMNLPDRLTERIDLAGEWKKWTGLAAVFAVWAARPDLPYDVVRHLREAARIGLAERETAYTGRAREYVTRDIRYELDDKALMGLRRYAALGARAGLLGTGEVDLFGPGTTVVPRPPAIDTLLVEASEGKHLTAAEAVRLEREAPVAELGLAANLRRRTLAPEPIATYLLTRDVHGPACAEPHVVTARIDGQTPEALAEALAADGHATEVGLVGGSWTVEQATTLLRRLERPVWGFTPDDVRSLAAHSGTNVSSVLGALQGAGLVGLVGHHPDSGPSQMRQDLEVLELAANAGLKVQASLALGVKASPEERVRYQLGLRELQARSLAVVALRVWTHYGADVRVATAQDTASDYLRLHALARLLVDGVPHLGTSWRSQGAGIAQAALHVGADDFGDVRVGADLRHGATATELSVEDLERHIRAAGLTPARRNLAYQRVGDALTRERRVRPKQHLPTVQ